MFGDLLKEGDPNPGGGSTGTKFVDANEGNGDFEDTPGDDFLKPQSSLWDE